MIVNKGQRSWSHADGGRPAMGGCWLASLESSGGRWPTATSGRRRLAGAGRRRPAVGGWLDVDMWHSMLALEGVALCVILIFFNDIFVN
ncbi:hypothetical protein ACE6H2_014883 [Prunus campanulata]